MKMRMLLSAVMATGMLLTGAVQANDRDGYRRDRHADHYDRYDDRRDSRYDRREHRDYRRYDRPHYRNHYYRSRPYYYGPHYYPRHSYYGYGYPYSSYSPYGLSGSIILTVPLN